MKVQPLIKNFRPKTFLNDYLSLKGVKDVDKYIAAGDDCFDNPWDYPHMEEAVDLLYKAIENESNIGILMDSDADGVLSSGLIYCYLTHVLNYYPNNIKIFIHKGKAHGLRKNIDEDLVEEAIEANINLLIVPDAGSDNAYESQELAAHGISMLVLDHHPMAAKDHKGVVINPHHGKGLNTSLSGTGVTHKFVQAYHQKYQENYLPHYEDMVALSLVSDICDLTSYENRAYLIRGLKLLDDEFEGNALLKFLKNKAARRGNNPVGLSWGVAPLINALCRSDNQENKLLFFRALVNEAPAEDGLKVSQSAHRFQSDLTKKIVGEVEDTIDYNHKALIGFTQPKYKQYIGLVANKFCGAERKPTILLRVKNSTTWSGSLRSPVPLATKINETKLAICQGHEDACGIEVKKSNLKRLQEWLDNLDLELKPVIPVTAEIAPGDINYGFCEVCAENKQMWGASMQSVLVTPTFYLKVNLSKDDILVCGKSGNSIRVNLGDVYAWKFGCPASQIEEITSQDYFTFECIVTLETDVWNNAPIEKVMIEQFEVSPIKTEVDEDGDWEALF